MNLVSKGAYALILVAVLCVLQPHQASALPMPSLAAAPPALLTPVACKYGSGKCPDVGMHRPPSVDKNGPQDPTKDPDCKAYGNCHDGPNGAPAAAAIKGTSTKPGSVVTSGGSLDMRKSGHDAPDLAKPTGPMKMH